MKSRLAFVLCLFPLLLNAQGDPRVLLQGFTWESHHEKSSWYKQLEAKIPEMVDTGFDLLWLPPPSFGEGAGYHPIEWNRLDNNYGTEPEHRSLLKSLLANFISPIADTVINHRAGSGGWAIFNNPSWPPWVICSTDEFWHQNPDHFYSAKDKEIFQKGDKGNPDYSGSDFPNWPGARDLDHDNPYVRGEVISYLRKLQSFGYRGWRYDMVKGFDPKYVGEYDEATQPNFSVGEYWDGNPYRLKDWVNATSSSWGKSNAFDFATYYRLKDVINGQRFYELPNILKDQGLLAFERAHAVTFLENHDTGKPQKPEDSFPDDKKLLQAYAYILTHPGVPSVFWTHFEKWKGPLKALIAARKIAGINSASQVWSHTKGNSYIAYVGENGKPAPLLVQIGYDNPESPNPEWKKAASGPGYQVWLR